MTPTPTVAPPAPPSPPAAVPCWLCSRIPATATADLRDCRGPVRLVRLCDKCFALPEREFVRRCLRRLGRPSP